MDKSLTYSLQSRWKQEGSILRYYGLRNKEHLFENTVKLTEKQKNIIEKLPCAITDKELSVLGKLVGNAVVRTEEVRKIPKNLSEARFCANCIANDFIIPGLEFDGNGFCPMCQTKKETEKLKSIVPIKNTFPHSKKSRFDVALFYTGGKDSTYLLYYLAKVQRLKVLALTWEIPYISDSARESIGEAKKRLPNVEFISRKVADSDLKLMYGRLYELSGNTCACPSLAYALFYPELVSNKVPYFVVGNETAQIVGLYYNRMAPKFAYSFADNKTANFFINVGRVVTLRPPLKRGQFHTIATMKQLAYGDNPLKKIFGYGNELVSNVVESMLTVPNMVKPLKRAIRISSLTGNIPVFAQVDFDEISGGKYDWKKIKSIIVKECGWVEPEENAKGLHTSCNIEKCKEYSQFKRFYDMESDMIPFSALELAIAVRDGNATREDALKELDCALGFSLEEVPECAIMKEYLAK